MVKPQDEFSYNCSINRSIGQSPFQIVYGTNPKGILDLVDLPISPHLNKEVADFVGNIRIIAQNFRLKL